MSNNKDSQKWDGIVDDFIRGYIPFYVPNAIRTYWPRDMQVGYTTKKLFSRYQFKKEDKQYVEAFNLIVEKINS